MRRSFPHVSSNVIVEREPMTIVSERLEGGPAAAAAARGLLSDLLGSSTPADALHDVQLLTTELVSNAVRHADVDETRTIGLDVAVAAGCVRVAVTDAGGQTHPRIQDLDPMVPGGMGLYLVEQISTRWGVERLSDGGNRVWFELSR
jgi:anti-sigma regulatory factor (Ser/Thr protein kinase)